MPVLCDSKMEYEDFFEDVVTDSDKIISLNTIVQKIESVKNQKLLKIGGVVMNPGLTFGTLP